MARERDVVAFDRRAGSYESGALGRWHALITRRTAGLALAAVPEPGCVLDVGCGTGALLRILAERLPAAAELHGVDPAPGMVERARAAAGSDPRIRVEEAAAERLPFADGAFDLVVSTVSFDHWDDQRGGLGECARVLRAGGVLVLADLFAAWLAAATAGPRRGRARTIRRAEPLLTAAGFRRHRFEHVYRLGPLPLVRAVIARR